MQKSLGIIGAGPSGLAAAKEAFDANFVNIKLFEKSENLGGIWNPNSGHVWPTMKTNISRFTTVFSQNSWDDNTDMFPESGQVFEYLKSFAEKYKILEHIQFNANVVSIDQVHDTLKWTVKILDSKTKTLELFEFDFIVIATGIFSKPYFPSFYNTVQCFRGLVIHSKSYAQNKSQLAGKNVALIGSSFSSSEIATDLVDHAKSVISVFKKPYWIIPRYLPVNDDAYKLPVDFVFYSQMSNYLSIQNEQKDPVKSCRSKNQYFAKLCSEQNKIESLKSISSEDEPPKVSISDTYVENVCENKIQVKQGETLHFTESGLCFKDNSFVNVDAVIFCTGFLASLDFFNEKIKRILEFDESDQFQPVLLHKCTFHPNLKNIAFVGMYRGPYFGVIELQARWAARVFSSKVNLTSNEDMKAGIDDQRNIRNKLPRAQFPHSYVELANSIAKELNLLPDFEYLKSNDQDAYKLLWEGVTVPDLYRFNEDKQLALETLKKINEKIGEFKLE
jgi:dimethylaniline monooxygenase (N-oxide forming)